MTEFVDDEGAPDFEGARDHVLGYLVSFARTLRRRGAAVPADASATAARALAEVGLDDRERVRAALRSTLIASEEDLDAFDRLFPSFWRQFRGEDDEFVPPEQNTGSPVPGAWTTGDDEADERPDSDDGPDETDAPSIQRTEVSGAHRTGDEDATIDDPSDERSATASVYSPAGRSSAVEAPRPAGDDDRLAAAVDRLADAIASRPGRRWERAGDGQVDTRRALRRSVATGGAVPSVPRRDRRRSAVHATVLVDVSRSVLDTIDREFLLAFLRTARHDWRDVRVFFFDTSLREVTEAFDAPTTAAAAEALERAEAEWGGGTRIGHALESVRRDHPDAVDRDTAVFVISDGLEVGELDVLASGVSWLSRRAGAVLWLNPLTASPEYEPTCRGMALSLPYVDGLFAFTGPKDVDEVARQIGRRGVGGQIGYRYDPRRRGDDGR